MTLLVQNFVFGYGSLMCRHSRAATVSSGSPLATATPVQVSGLQVQWSTRVPHGMTALGVTPRPDSTAIGVLVPVTEMELVQFDEREGDGYQRKALALRDVEKVSFLPHDEHYAGEQHKPFLTAKESQGNADTVQIWVYVQKDPAFPTQSHPIVQTYLDTILRGCLEISDDFAVTFLRLVRGWYDDEDSSGSNAAGSGGGIAAIHYANDRHAPVYARGDVDWSRRHALTLDAMMRAHRPFCFQHRTATGTASAPRCGSGSPIGSTGADAI